MGIKEELEKKKELWFQRAYHSALDGLKHTAEIDAVFQENERKTNVFSAKTMIAIAIIFFVVSIGNYFEIFLIPHTTMRIGGLVTEFFLLVPALITLKFENTRLYMRRPLIYCAVIAVASMYAAFTYSTVMILAVPVVLSCRYSTKSFTKSVVVFSTVMFAAAAVIGNYVGLVDSNNVVYEEGTKLVFRESMQTTVYDMGLNRPAFLLNTMLQSFIPLYLVYAVLCAVCIKNADRSHKMIISQDTVSKEHARVEGELEMASRIQNQALPIVHSVGEHMEFEVFASMDPAKEVGGDFYDFFYVDSSHVALIVADVSGKGVPAALYMMISKLLLDNAIQDGKTPSQVLAEVNHQLCEKDIEDMFVTAWLGIIDLETGVLLSSNAGHEYPIIRRGNGSFEMFKDTHRLALGVIDGTTYVEDSLKLNPGDTLFVYTDGVMEASSCDPATGHRDFYGKERTIMALQNNGSGSLENLCKGLKEDIDKFVGDSEQFDDITMLAFRLSELQNKEGISITPDFESIKTVAEYVETAAEAAGVPMKPITKMNIAVDEIYSNIVRYSTATIAEAFCSVRDGRLIVRFRDNGIPYNPLEKQDPDIDTALSDDTEGGFGVFITKNLMTDVSYSYTGGWNEMTLELQYE